MPTYTKNTKIIYLNLPPNIVQKIDNLQKNTIHKELKDGKLILHSNKMKIF